MAILDKIVVQDFRNIALAELEFSPKFNCISGNNGEGKTNLMDAIWYLSMTKSAFSSSEKYNFRHGCESFSIAGEYLMDNGLKSRFSISVGSGGEKRLRRDEKPYGRISEHIGELPIVMVSPSDISMVSESGDERRRFLNAVLSQMDREYLSGIQQYNRLLAQRNKVLKEDRPDPDLLSVIDGRMAVHADRIYRWRKEFADGLEPAVAEYYGMISAGHETVSVKYVSDLSNGSLEDILARNRERDIVLGYTSSGIQRDDLDFLLDGHPMRRCGSQGQQKSFLVALKFAQYEIMKAGYGFPPILLLDDVFDKLDYSRISNLLAMVAGKEFGQIFITDSDRVRISGIVDRISRDRAYYNTVAGEFTREEIDG